MSGAGGGEGGRTHPRRAGCRAAGVLLALSGLAACDGGGPVSTGPLTVSEVTEGFATGDTVTIQGSGLAGAAVTLDGTAVPLLDAGDARIRFLAPAGLPPCADPFPTVTLSVSSRGGQASRTLAVRGSPRELVLSPGQHAARPADLPPGCPVRLGAGNYAVAVFTVVPPNPTDPQDGMRAQRAPYTLRVTAPRAGAASTRLLARLPWPQPSPMEAHGGWPLVPPGGAATDSHGCTRPPAEQGSVVRVRSHPYTQVAATEPVSDYRVVSTSAHFAVLMRDVELAALSAAGRDSAGIAAAVLEEEVHSSLHRFLGPLPDTDGDGRLNVVFTALGPNAIGVAGNPDTWADGCRGDFVWIVPAMLGTMAPPFRGLQSLVIHEATHWVDFEAGGFGGKASWSIEGYAVLADRLSHEERYGIGFWAGDDDGGTCGYGCTYVHLREDRYGVPGLADGYANGTTILRYLVQQALPPGTDHAPAVAALRTRQGWHLRSIFEHLGGQGRTEEELQGELLLMHFADGTVPGVSPRIRHHTFDLAALWRAERSLTRFPMSSFTLSAPARLELPLSVPDGLVGEVVVLAGGATIEVRGGRPQARLAILRVH
ncbi:MAG TPA: hypothetical protein VHG08_09795 [Longimicrobium sp.]|nr:hypothetical protein [Longimicrobium sp.]